MSNRIETTIIDEQANPVQIGADLHRLIEANMNTAPTTHSNRFLISRTGRWTSQRNFVEFERGAPSAARERAQSNAHDPYRNFMDMDYGRMERSVFASMYQGDWWDDGATPSVADGAGTRPIDAPDRSTLVRTPSSTLTLDDPRTCLAMEAEALLGYAPLRTDCGAPGALKATLARLEIDILDEASVDAYKAQMVQHYRSHGKMADPTWRLTDLREYAQPVPEHVLAKACSIKKALPQAQFYVDQLAVDPFLIVSLAPIADHWTNRARRLDPDTQAYLEVWDEPKFEGMAWASEGGAE